MDRSWHLGIVGTGDRTIISLVDHRGRRMHGKGDEMELLEGLLKAGLTIVALVVVIGLLAALFMIIFGIATGIDDTMQG